MAKSEQTRTLIMETALRLFQEQGYDRTTMRAVAKQAGVSTGNAYYYFESKDHLIQGFYDRIQAAHRDACTEILASERDFAPRLRGVLLAWLDVAEPYHEFAGQFFKNAADPASPLSPFSDSSQPARAASIGLFEEVLAGVRLDPGLRAELPRLLWLYLMGIVLFWVHDRSAGRSRSRMLVNRTVPLVDRLIHMSRLPGLRPITREIVSLAGDLSAGRTPR
ncbi:TetR family transcriptional regulator [Actinocrispum sp. NPDC049592]|uniref:TetR/AcrR family transcriptional regulator n=1 Tax=Actinocrispum sp. NPDC049592 TaxID=3154835 RepID=UPI00342A7A7B